MIDRACVKLAGQELWTLGRITLQRILDKIINRGCLNFVLWIIVAVQVAEQFQPLEVVSKCALPRCVTAEGLVYRKRDIWAMTKKPGEKSEAEGTELC